MKLSEFNFEIQVEPKNTETAHYTHKNVQCYLVSEAKIGNFLFVYVRFCYCWTEGFDAPKSYEHSMQTMAYTICFDVDVVLVFLLPESCN